jgi:hypothetical protein
VARNAWQWATSHLEEFRLQKTGVLDELARLKPVVELATAADLLVARHPDAYPLEVAARRVIDFCWTELGRGELLVSLVGQDPRLAVLAPVYAPFPRWGLRNEALDTALGDAVRSVSEDLSGSHGWQELELAVTFAALGIDAPWNVTDAYRSTWALAIECLPDLDERALYTLAHAVFYRTDYGRVPDALPAPHRAVLVEELPHWIQTGLDDGQLDVAGELILAARCAGIADGGDCANRFLEAQEPDGMIPAPRSRWRRLQPEVDDPAQRRFLDHYHTTLVCMLAAAFSSEWTEVSSRSGDTPAVLRKKALLRLLARDRAERIGLVPTDDELQAAADEFRRAVGLLTVAQFEQWFSTAGITEDEWVDYLRDATLIERIGAAYEEEVNRLADAHDRVASARRVRT